MQICKRAPKMNIDIENPFADYGTIVYGDRFIGRKESLKVIENKIFHPKEAGNLAIIGEPRIGKSSLVYKGIVEKKEGLLKKNLLPIWINLAMYQETNDFFCSLVEKCLSEMKPLEWITKPIQKSGYEVFAGEFSWIERYNRIQKFFEDVRKAGYRILFILDEFDHARQLFKGNISGFQGLRELSYRPEWRVTFITTSRRSIREIEIQTGAISTFDGIFHKHHLAMFTDEEVEEFFNRFSSMGIKLSDKLKEEFLFYCGGHPYLLEMIGYEIVELFSTERRVDVETAAQRTLTSLITQYDHIISLMKEDGSFHKLIQILFGPVIDVKTTDVDRFLKYGLIKLNSAQSYVAYSDHFQYYLNLVERESGLIDLWPIWRDTEKALRTIIVITLVQEYGESWIEEMEKRHPKLKEIFETCRKLQIKEQSTFGNRASNSLLDYAYPSELFQIIFCEWNKFNSIFGKDKNYWEQRRQLLSKIRNPMAHNRDDSIHDYERQIAEGYCKEIITLISQHLKNS